MGQIGEFANDTIGKLKLFQSAEFPSISANNTIKGDLATLHEV